TDDLGQKGFSNFSITVTPVEAGKDRDSDFDGIFDLVDPEPNEKSTKFSDARNVTFGEILKGAPSLTVKDSVNPNQGVVINYERSSNQVGPAVSVKTCGKSGETTTYTLSS